MKKYSKVIASVVSAVVAFVVIQFAPDLDAGLIEGTVIAILTSLGVYAAPANA